MEKVKPLPDTILLDCIEQDIKSLPHGLEHAQNIFDIQSKINRNDWTLSPGQNLALSNGKIIYTTSSRKDESAKTESGAGRDKEA